MHRGACPLRARLPDRAGKALRHARIRGVSARRAGRALGSDVVRGEEAGLAGSASAGRAVGPREARRAVRVVHLADRQAGVPRGAAVATRRAPLSLERSSRARFMLRRIGAKIPRENPEIYTHCQEEDDLTRIFAQN